MTFDPNGSTGAKAAAGRIFAAPDDGASSGGSGEAAAKRPLFFDAERVIEALKNSDGDREAAADSLGISLNVMYQRIYWIRKDGDPDKISRLVIKRHPHHPNLAWRAPSRRKRSLEARLAEAREKIEQFPRKDPLDIIEALRTILLTNEMRDDPACRELYRTEILNKLADMLANQQGLDSIRVILNGTVTDISNKLLTGVRGRYMDMVRDCFYIIGRMDHTKKTRQLAIKHLSEVSAYKGLDEEMRKEIEACLARISIDGPETPSAAQGADPEPLGQQPGPGLGFRAGGGATAPAGIEQHGIILSDMFKLARPDGIIVGRDWLREVTGGKLSEQDINKIMSGLRNEFNRGKKEGEDVFFDVDDEDVAQKLRDVKARNPNAKVVVLAKETTIAAVENTDKNTVFAAIDNIDLLDAAGLEAGKEYYIRIFEMLSVAMTVMRRSSAAREEVIADDIIQRLAAEHPELGIKLTGSRTILYKPIAEPHEYEVLRLMYEAQVNA